MSTIPMLLETGHNSFTQEDQKRINNLQLQVAQLSLAMFPKFLSPGEVALMLKRNANGIPSIARAFRALRERYDVESLPEGDVVKYRVRPHNTDATIVGKLHGRNPANAQKHSERSLNRETVRTWSTSKFPNWFTKSEAAYELHIDKEKISSFHTLLTDIRKRDHMTVEARRIGDGGLWEYRVWPLNQLQN